MTKNYLDQFERDLFNKGYQLIAGTDEAGRGPLFGPVVAAAVILPKGFWLEGLNDSKKLTAKKRLELYQLIIKEAIAYSIVKVDVKTIDAINILQAAKLAMHMAIDGLAVAPDFILSDHVKLKYDNHLNITKGDELSYSIAAASILAKVYRDQLIDELALKYPQYDLAKNKGYGTKSHLAAIKAFGITPEHRQSFKPIKQAIKK